MSQAVARWLDRPPPGWERWLDLDPSAGPSHRPVFARALESALSGMTPAWVVVERDGQPIGGAPAMIERRAAFHWIHAMPFLLPGTPLAVAGEHESVDHEVAVALDHRARELHVAGGSWVVQRPGASEPVRLPEAPRGETRLLDAALVPLGGGIEPAWRAVQRHTRQSIQIARAAGLTATEAPDELERAYALYHAQARRWAGHRPRSLPLLRRLVEGDDPAGRLFVVRDRRGLLAAVLVLVSRREWFAWWSGVHPEARRSHAFPLLLWEVAERAAAAGADRLQLGGSAAQAGVAQFKQRLGALEAAVPVRWIGSEYAGVAGRLVAALQRRLRAGRARGTPA